MRTSISSFALLLLAACGGADTPAGAAEPESAGGSAPVALPPAGDLAATIASAHRSESNRARDRYRHPQETLSFFGLRPDMTVVEIRPGGGWYTEILAPYLRERGSLVVGIPSADGPRARYRQRFLDMQRDRGEVLGQVVAGTFAPPDDVQLGEDGSADLVVTFRNTHNMVNDGVAEAAYEAFFRVLRPGGVLGVVQHRAAEGATATESARTGYVPEAYVIEIAEAAGFELEERSEINANPDDTRDHPEGVWTLPPVLRLGDTDRERYLAIGESDRMTLRFRKPAP